MRLKTERPLHGARPGPGRGHPVTRAGAAGRSMENGGAHLRGVDPRIGIRAEPIAVPGCYGSHVKGSSFLPRMVLTTSRSKRK
jgi:hypothetical protein